MIWPPAMQNIRSISLTVWPCHPPYIKGRLKFIPFYKGNFIEYFKLLALLPRNLLDQVCLFFSNVEGDAKLFVPSWCYSGLSFRIYLIKHFSITYLNHLVEDNKWDDFTNCKSGNLFSNYLWIYSILISLNVNDILKLIYTERNAASKVLRFFNLLVKWPIQLYNRLVILYLQVKIS